MSYQPTLESIANHPLPEWYSDAKFGIFIHWGVYSVPAFAPRCEDFLASILEGKAGFEDTPYAEWYQNSLRVRGSAVYRHHMATYGAGVPYEQFAERFNEQIRYWDPDSWANLFSGAGARYVVLVSKHHDGFLLWNSRHQNPRIPNWQASRDIVGELAAAVKEKGLKLGLYYSSLLDWSFTTKPITSIAGLIAGSDTSREYLDYVENHWLELITRYDPWILWGDIGYPPGYHLPKLFAHYYNQKPEGVVNDRWLQTPKSLFNPLGRYILNQLTKRLDSSNSPKAPHSDFMTPEYATLDSIATHKWETCRGIGNSFGYNQMEDASDYQNASELIRLLMDIVSKNGNLLLNVGPYASGEIHPAQTEVLEGIGAWLKVNGEAVYGTRPWKRFMDSEVNGGEVRYTTRGDALYVAVVQPPAQGQLSLPNDVGRECCLLETGEKLQAIQAGEKLMIRLPENLAKDSIPVVKIR